MKGYIIILGTLNDPHVERVFKHLSARFDLLVKVIDYQNETDVSLEISDSGEIKLTIDNELITSPYLIWNREKITEGTPGYLFSKDQNTNMWAAREWKAFFKLISGLNGERVLNSLASQACLIKPKQQLHAIKSGFKAPSSLITNTQGHAISFNKAHNGSIMKSISGGKLTHIDEAGNKTFKNVMTMRVQSEDLTNANKEDIAYHPHFFQHEINKAFELRVVVIGIAKFAFMIDSQASTLTELDWRKGIRQIDFLPYKLNSEIDEKITRFMESMGLFTGSIDIIISKSGEAYFIECNQDGAWAWLDDLVDGAISFEFSNAFAEKLKIITEKKCHEQLTGHISL